MSGGGELIVVCACDHVIEEHEGGGGACTVEGCPCQLFDELADPDDLRG